MQNLQNDLSLIERLSAPTPKPFKLIRTLGILLGLLGAAILSAEQKGIEIPALVSFFGAQASAIAGIIASAVGITAVAVSQTAVDFTAYKRAHELDSI